MTTNNFNTQSDVLKFQDLKDGDRYIVKGLKPVDTKYGKSYMLYIVENEDETPRKLWSTNKINEYIIAENLEKKPEKFEFTVREIKSGIYKSKLSAEIDGFIGGGVVWL